MSQESEYTELLAKLDAEKAALLASLAERRLPTLRPDMADIFRRKATTLAVELESPTLRDGAREALRSFLTRIVIPPGDGLLQVVGNVEAMLAAAEGPTRAGSWAVGQDGCGGGI